MIYEVMHVWRRVVRGRRVGGKKAGDKATISSGSGLRASPVCVLKRARIFLYGSCKIVRIFIPILSWL